MRVSESASRYHWLRSAVELRQTAVNAAPPVNGNSMIGNFASSILHVMSDLLVEWYSSVPRRWAACVQLVHAHWAMCVEIWQDLD